MNQPSQPEFDAYAEAYDQALQQGLRFSGESKDYFAFKRIEWLKNRLQYEGVSCPHTILDYGCGTGGSISFLRDAFRPGDITGVDVSAASVALARKILSGPDVHFGTLDETPPTGRVDLAFCNGVFHHIPPTDRAACVRYVFESLRPGGIFAFWENNPWNPGTRFIMSRVPFDRDAILLSIPEARGLLREGGFEVLGADTLFYFPKALGFLRPLENFLHRLPLGGQYLLLARKPL